MTIYINNAEVDEDYHSQFNCDVTPIIPYLKKINDIKFCLIDNLHPDYLDPGNLNDYDFIIVPAYTHPDPHNPEVLLTNTPQLTITWDTSLKVDKIYFPYFATTHFYPPDVDRIITRNDFRRRFICSCLNNIAKEHRVAMVNELYKLTNFNNIIISLSNTVLLNPYTKLTFKNFYEYIKKLSDSDIELAKKIYNRLPLTSSIELTQYGWELGETLEGQPNWINHPAYVDSYFNIVTESQWEYKFFSEKTFKPIASDQMFVIAAGAGTVELVRSLGFDVYDDYINHSYDLESNNQKRFNMLIKEIERLLSLDWYDIYQKTLERRRNNRKLFLSNNISHVFATQLEKKIRSTILSSKNTKPKNV